MLVTTNFNAKHPEKKKTEVFICNNAFENYRRLRYQTKRRGHQAYDVLGNPMRGVQPVFVEYTEMLADGFVKGQGGFLKHDPEKAANLLPIWDRVTANVRASQMFRLGNTPRFANG